MKKMRQLGLAVILAITVAMMFQTTEALAQSSQADANVESYQNFSPTFEGSGRNYPNGGLPGFPQLPGNFAQPLSTHEFLSLKTFSEMKTEWTKDEIENWSEDSDRKNVNISNRKILLELEEASRIKMVMEKPAEYQFIGMLVANAIKAETPSEAVFSVLAEDALKNGANVMVPLNEGARRVLEASGWGISLGFTFVQIGGGSEQSSGVGAAGIGFTKGQSSHRHEPFARVMLARVSPELYAQLGAPDQPPKQEVPAEKPDTKALLENNQLLRKIISQKDVELKQREMLLHEMHQQKTSGK
jgi:hypothetical protein